MEIRKFILCVDNEESNLSSIKASLSRDFLVYTVKSLETAKHLLRLGLIEALVVYLRSNSDLPLITRILVEYSDIPCVIVSDSSNRQVEIEQTRAGFIQCSSSLGYSELHLVISKMLECAELRDHCDKLKSEIEHKESRASQLRRIAQSYVPASVLEQLLDRQEGEWLSMETREMTVMFVDIREYVSTCVDLSCDRIARFLNVYFSAMNAIVTDFEGVVLQFYGDGFLAVFDSPISAQESENNAVSAALAMIEKLHEFNRIYAFQLIGGAIAIGIGIERGEVAVGNIGSLEKMEYHAVGQTVNIAARIQDKTKPHPNSIIVSENVRDRVKDAYQFEDMGRTHLRGCIQPQRLYRVVVNPQPVS